MVSEEVRQACSFECVITYHVGAEPDFEKNLMCTMFSSTLLHGKISMQFISKGAFKGARLPDGPPLICLM